MAPPLPKPEKWRTEMARALTEPDSGHVTAPVTSRVSRSSLLFFLFGLGRAQLMAEARPMRERRMGNHVAVPVTS